MNGGKNMVKFPPDIKRVVPTPRWKTILRIGQKALISVGVALLGFYALARVDGAVTSYAAVRNFEDGEARSGGNSTESRSVDYSLWSAVRIKAYKQSLKQSGPAIALLRIPKLRIVAPVMEGIGDVALNVGVGHIPGTARPGEPGNLGLAGHRDGFFRGLKDIHKGDTIEVVTAGKTEVYAVDDVKIVKPADVQVLRASATPSVTLVTCYPFYFAGNAPQRYIVHASLKGPAGTAGK
ncbi:MAG TPA: class D sortase [Candidatus Angelobacter sp.]|nr:class D sortase [Candidatus Angelobacter sp.]